MKPFYAPQPTFSNSSTGDSSTEGGSDDDSEQMVYSQKVTKDGGQEQPRTMPKKDVTSQSDSEATSDESDDSPPPQKAPLMSPELKKRKEDSRSNTAELPMKQEKLPKGAIKGEFPKAVIISEDKSKPAKNALQQKRSGKQHDVSEMEAKKGDPQALAQKKGSQVKASPRKRKLQEELEEAKSPNPADVDVKSRKSAQVWAPKDELLLANHFLADTRNGVNFPLKKSESYWDELRERLAGKLETNWSKDQIYDKCRRMKSRYDVLNERLKSEDPKLPKYKGVEEEKLFKVFQQIWGKEAEENDEIAVENFPAAADEKIHRANEMNHTEDEDEESSGGDDERVTEQPGQKRPTKDARQRKASPRAEADQNGLPSGQTGIHHLNDKNLPEKAGLPSDLIIRKEEFDKTPETFAARLWEELQDKFLEHYKQEQAKTHALIEQTVKDLNDKFRGLSQLVMTSLLGGSTGSFLPRSLGGFAGGFSSEDDGSVSSFQGVWLEQQIQEVQLNVNRLQLMQEILRARQELLKGKTQ